MPAKKQFKTKFNLEMKSDPNNTMSITITLDLNHPCDLVDRVLESMTSACITNLINYQNETEKPKKNKKSYKCNNVV